MSLLVKIDEAHYIYLIKGEVTQSMMAAVREAWTQFHPESNVLILEGDAFIDAADPDESA